MKILYIFLVLFLICIIWLRRKQKKDADNIQGSNNQNDGPQTKAECKDKSDCGSTCFCDDITLKRICNTEPVYFDDEELDAYKGTEADKYTDQQTEEFEEILNTMHTEEVPEWLHSLELRGIKLPTKLKDEVVMLLQKN